MSARREGISDRDLPSDPLLAVHGLKVHFERRRGFFGVGSREVVRAVDGVDLAIGQGRTVGLVGESGSGKSTVARAVVGLVRPTAGGILFGGNDVAKVKGRRLREIRSRLGVVFQDPFAALDPRMNAESIVSEPLKIHPKTLGGRSAHDRASELFESVSLNQGMMDRYPHEFSGGQRQRLGIARAVATNPDLVILDEPVSALDVSIQGQILNLLQSLQDSMGVAFLFIAHDLAVVRHMSDDVVVMYLGKVMESAPVGELFGNPLHPYTQALLSAMPVLDPNKARNRRRIVLSGEIPSPSSPPSGCVFRTRCPIASEECATTAPVLRENAPGHRVSCFKVR